MIFRIGTRGSKLALVQSQWVKKCIEDQYTNIQVELVKIKTKGDKILDSPLSKIGGKGLFVKEIEDAILRREIDVAVHSMKDVPAEIPEELMLTVFPIREDPRDALVTHRHPSLDQLPPGSKVGTSSLRRAAQLLHVRPDLHVMPLRGNVDTRLKKLETGNLQAIVLAAAGLKRLGFSNRITQYLSTEQILPAIGQGALGLEARRKDKKTNEILSFLNHGPTETAIKAERAFLKELQGGCQVPIAAYAVVNGDTVYLRGMVAELDGSDFIGDEITGKMDSAKQMGRMLAKRLLDAGAGEILKRIYSADKDWELA